MGYEQDFVVDEIAGIDTDRFESGMEAGIVTFKENDLDGDIVCCIGDYWFYFGGTEIVGMSLDEFWESFSGDTIARMCVDAMCGLDEDERRYYGYIFDEANIE